jgi:ribosomal protein S8E
MHIVNAENFKGPSPRWIDEGMAMTTETDAEKSKFSRMLSQFMQQGRIPNFNQIAEQKQYIADIATYGTENRVKIAQLKAVKILRSKDASSLSDEEYIQTIQKVTNNW